MKTLYIILFLSLLNNIDLVGQCGNATQDTYNLVTITGTGGSTSATITATATNSISYTSGIFGSLWIKTLNSSSVSISGTSSTGLAWTQEVLSEDLGEAPGFKYTYFSSVQVINPSTLFPVGAPVIIGTLNISPASSLVEVVMTDLFAPTNNGGLYVYYRTAIQVCNTNNFEDNLIQETSNIVLPITIKTFSATKDGERSSRLDWTSSSEINSDYIGIERSTDGEDWTTVGQVKAAGNSNRDIDYIYYDRSLPMARSIDNIFYYRLRLTDLDGQYKYSETRGVNMGRLEGLVSIYPNPATDIINVDLTDMDLHEGIIHLSVYDNTGKAIISKEVNGAGIEPIQASNMAAGSYQVVVKQGDTTHRKQIIVVN